MGSRAPAWGQNLSRPSFRPGRHHRLNRGGSEATTRGGGLAAMRVIGWIGVVTTCVAGGLAVPASAFEARSGTFVADEACTATARIKDRSGISLEPGSSYQLLGVNRADATHYLLRLPDGGDRWVPVTCGHLPGAGGADGYGSGPRPE